MKKGTQKRSKRKEPEWWERWIRLRDSTGLLINVGLQGDGATYSLDSTAKQRLEGIPSNAPRPRSVFIGHQRDSEFETLHAPQWPRIVEMLTGLTLEQFKPFAPIRIYSSDQERIVWEWPPNEVTSLRGRTRAIRPVITPI